MNIRGFVERYGEPYSKALGINLESGRNEEIVKWFLASILYAKPIRENAATLTYRTFEDYGVLTADKILETGWDGLVKILDEGRYVRYDFSTATKLLNVFGTLKRDYSDLWQLYNAARDSRDLEERLKSLGKGIGDVTVAIFLRDMRSIWSKADPKPTQLVQKAMNELSIQDLRLFSKQHGLDLVRLETALLRLEKDFIRKGIKIDTVVYET
ncbi:MAG: hypothetical protein M1503_07270 [Thaumarchaeota archaeon]|nr:hypothetical protein [Nitrososphaerota archaeon]MCL5318041.1 hypothetical protein [Nitrososphaerota archaeon]